MSLRDYFKIDITADASDFNQKMGAVAGRMEKMGKRFAQVGKSMSLGITAPIVGVGALFVKTAGDAQEMQSKFDTVFGSTSKSVEKWADRYGNAVGRSKQELMSMASTVQDTFVPLGFARGEASEMAKTMTQLAVDMASFNNKSDTETMEALQSAIVGNHETMRQYGVIITQATLDQELLNMGVAKGVQGATEQEKVQARLNIIMKGTSDAQGDAAKTSGSFANQIKATTAEFSEMAIELGQALMPAAMKVIGWAKEGIAWFRGLDAGTKTIILSVAGLAATLGPVAIALGLVVAGIGAVMSPIALAVVAFGALAAAAWAFRDEIGTAISGVASIFQNFFIKPIDMAISYISNAYATFIAWIADKASAIADFFGFDSVSTKLAGFSAGLSQWAGENHTIIADTYQAVGDAVGGAVERVTGGVHDMVAGAKGELAGLVDQSALAAVPGGETGEVDPVVETNEQNASAVKDIWGGVTTFLAGDSDKRTQTEAKNWGQLFNQMGAGSKKLQKIQKAGAIASVIQNTAAGVMKAVASAPFPANIPAIAFATAQGAVSLSTVKGQFHDGIDNVPSTGTYLLDKGERVVDSRLNGDLKAFLSAQGTSSKTFHNSPTFQFNNATPDAEEALRANRGVLASMIQDLYNEDAQDAPFAA